jgi:hypothetical protein
MSINLNSPKAYFRADDDKLTNPNKRKIFVALECELQKLDEAAWEFLKGEALPCLKAVHPTRKWQQLFDTLNEIAAEGRHWEGVDAMSEQQAQSFKVGTSISTM